jgi:hypothetical protein
MHMLLDWGADVNATVFNWVTLLSYACRWGQSQAVRRLLQAGARVDVQPDKLLASNNSTLIISYWLQECPWAAAYLTDTRYCTY